MFYFASDERASKIIVRESPRCMKSHFTPGQYLILFFFDTITYRRAIGEREIKYHFISRCSKGTPLAQRAIKLTLLTARVDPHLSKITTLRRDSINSVF